MIWDPKNLLDPKISSDPKFLCNPKYFGPNIFSDPRFYGPKVLLVQKNSNPKYKTFNWESSVALISPTYKVLKSSNMEGGIHKSKAYSDRITILTADTDRAMST